MLLLPFRSETKTPLYGVKKRERSGHFLRYRRHQCSHLPPSSLHHLRLLSRLENEDLRWFCKGVTSHELFPFLEVFSPLVCDESGSSLVPVYMHDRVGNTTVVGYGGERWGGELGWEFS